MIAYGQNPTQELKNKNKKKKTYHYWLQAMQELIHK